MLHRSQRSFVLAFAAILAAGIGGTALWARALGARTTSPSPLALIVVDTETRTRLAAHLETYRADAAASLEPTYETAVRVEMLEVDRASYFPAGTVDEAGHVRLTLDVARMLESRYRDDGLVGIVLVGTLPLPRAEDDGTPRLSLYPWVDFDAPAFVPDSTGRFVRSEERDPRPELWSGVLRDPGNPLPAETFLGSVAGSAPATLEQFFLKNHAAHAGTRAFPKRVLLNDIAAEEAMRDIRLPDGRTPSATELPGGSEVARRSLAERFARRLVSTGRYDGVNYADDFLPKKLPDDAAKTLRELLKKARDDKKSTELQKWRAGSGPVKQIDVASQVILYFDAWTEEKAGALDASVAAARSVAGDDFDLFSKDGYDPCLDIAPKGRGYFGLTESQRAAISAASGSANRAEFEFLLRWRVLYDEEDKRLWLLRDGVPRFGKYSGLAPETELLLSVAPGGETWVIGATRVDGVCFQRGATDRTVGGGAFTVVLGAATARERSAEPAANVALWSALTGRTQAAYGCGTPPPSLTVPANIATMSRDAVSALARSSKPAGFGRMCAASGSAEGVGFDTDPFLLSVLSGVPFGEAVRPTLDETAVLYGDPTFHLE